jgi:YHS domain-containing protein
MGTLLWFLLIAGFFFLMMRGGCGSHVMGHGQGQHAGHQGQDGSVPPTGAARWTPPRTEIDPVCGMTVNTDDAKSSVYNGSVYYFCSAEHRDQFEADPERYLGGRARLEAPAMEHSDG